MRMDLLSVFIYVLLLGVIAFLAMKPPR